jgi:hypothetical protein
MDLEGPLPRSSEVKTDPYPESNEIILSHSGSLRFILILSSTSYA